MRALLKLKHVHTNPIGSWLAINEGVFKKRAKLEFLFYDLFPVSL
jgi:hypothetical protein